MKKYKWLTILASFALALTLLSFAWISMINHQGDYGAYYEKHEIEKVSGISTFEATLNYEHLKSGFRLENKDAITLATYEINNHSRQVLEKVRNSYHAAWYLAVISLIVTAAFLMYLKKRRKYEFVLWGSLAGIGSTLLVPVFLFVFKHALFRNLWAFLIKGDGSGIFYNDTVMASLIPGKWALRQLFIFEGNLIILAGICIFLYFIVGKNAKPHKF